MESEVVAVAGGRGRILQPHLIEFTPDEGTVLDVQQARALHQFVADNSPGHAALLVRRVNRYQLTQAAQGIITHVPGLIAIAFVDSEEARSYEKPRLQMPPGAVSRSYHEVDESLARLWLEDVLENCTDY